MSCRLDALAAEESKTLTFNHTANLGCAVFDDNGFCRRLRFF